jgi:hypothetical protein
VENGAKFSASFVLNGELTRLLAQIFEGTNKHVNVWHFLTCCAHLFKYKLSEVFDLTSSSTLSSEVKILDDKVNEKPEENELTVLAFKDGSKPFQSSNIPTRTLFVLSEMIDEFLLNVYAICLRVIKDYKVGLIFVYSINKG